MPTMSELIRNDEVDKVEFKWGAKRGIGGTKKDVQFYESFTYDGLDYSLFDSVYLFKDGETDPYIGKLIKIWEPANKSKKVKVLWFFRPSEISNHLEGLQTLKNELFLGTGVGSDGSGLDNINPLEAIAGKCNVVCISKDARNRQPLPEELTTADYVFYRTFDVDKFTITDKLGEHISKVKVTLLLNNAHSQIFSPLRIESSDRGHDGHLGVVPVEQGPRAKYSLDTREHSAVNSDRDVVNVEPSKKDNVSDGKKVGFKPVEVQENSITSHKEASSTDHLKLDLDSGANYSSDKFKVTGEKEALSKPAEDSNQKKNNEYNKDSHGSFKVKSRVNSADVSMDDRPSKKLKSAEPVGTGGKTKAPLSSALDGANAHSKQSNKDTRVYGRIVEVTQRPEADSSKWFTGLPWEDTMKAAQEEGTLVLLQNLDPSYTSSEIEDIVWHSFRENCTGKVLHCAAISSPHSGQAFVIFRTKQAAVRVVRQLEEGCLMLPNGRPLVGHVAEGHLPGKSSSFPGHLFIDRLKFQLQKEKREAVSTSHSSQPNTLEYDMAMEWRLLQERSELMRKNLLKKQGEELKKLRENLRRKYKLLMKSL